MQERDSEDRNVVAQDTQKDKKESPTGTDNPYFDMLHEMISTPAKIVSDGLKK